jgi:hypothetical protein
LIKKAAVFHAFPCSKVSTHKSAPL